MNQPVATTASSTAPGVTVVTCVEFGPLEIMTVRMIESLRRWGGRMAQSPVIAVTPRFGLPLRKETLAHFERLNVRHVKLKSHPQYGWYNFLNKPLAVNAAEEFATTPQMLWLDADILVLQEPTALFLNDGEDFAACASDKNVGTAGPHDKWEPYWQAMCDVFGISLSSLPWVTTIREDQLIRFYWNGGVLAYRRGLNYAQQYLNDTIKLLDAHFRLPDDGVFFHEQAACGLAALKLGLRYRALEDDHNRPIGKKIKHLFTRERLRTAKLFHYHGSMWPDFWSEFVEYFREDRPDVHAWLSTLPPVTHNPALPLKVAQRLIVDSRVRHREKYLKTCRTIQLNPETSPIAQDERLIA